MAKHYLNAITVTLRAYSGHPATQDFEEAFSLGADIAAELDLDEFANEIKDDVAPPRIVTQTYRETTWGASGSGAQIIIDVLSSAASVITIWDKVSAQVLRHGRARTHVAATPAESARSAMAENLNTTPGEIRVTGLDAIEAGHRVRLQTPHGRFTVDVGESGVIRIKRIAQ